MSDPTRSADPFFSHLARGGPTSLFCSGDSACCNVGRSAVNDQFSPSAALASFTRLFVFWLGRSPFNSQSLAANAVSTDWASDVVSWFFWGRMRPAQTVSASVSVKAPSSAINCSRWISDLSGVRMMRGSLTGLPRRGYGDAACATHMIGVEAWAS